jgi:hypothetical protein
MRAFGFRRRRAGVAVTLGGLVLAIGIGGGAIAAVSSLMGGDVFVAGETVAPALPVSVGGIALNVPTAAIRVAKQRKAGAQERLDLAFSFPDLGPANAPVTGDLVPREAAILFVSLTRPDGAMTASERQRTLYPRFLAAESRDAGDGLTATPFRRGSPYQGEDFIRDTGKPDGFAARCTRDEDPMPGQCWIDRRVAGLDVTVRFPRAWLGRWREVDAASRQAVAQLRPPAR